MKLPVFTRMGDYLQAMDVRSDIKPGDCVLACGQAPYGEQSVQDRMPVDMHLPFIEPKFMVRCVSMQMPGGWSARYLMTVNEAGEELLRNGIAPQRSTQWR